MNQSYKKLSQILSILLLAGGGFSVHAADSTAEAFPDPKSSYLKTGDFIGPDHVKRIESGMKKDQVRLELGNPHFDEGILGEKTWNYLFNFYTGNGNEYVTCQYRVKFDDDYRVKSSDWKDSQCEDYIDPPVIEVKVYVPAPTPAVEEASVLKVAPEPGPVHQRLVLEGGALFAFGQSGINDLVAEGHAKLDAFVNQINQDGIKLSSVTVTGYTDYLGSDYRNLALSQARADSVAEYLKQKGIDGNLIAVDGAGEAKPVVSCEEKGSKKSLIACLQPNRRVEIEIEVTK
jgi:outer membrane protein OmpA-like peptidoglycan-associated protein